MKFIKTVKIVKKILRMKAKKENQKKFLKVKASMNKIRMQLSMIIISIMLIYRKKKKKKLLKMLIMIISMKKIKIIP